MSTLYIRLRTGFFTHRKTIRLRSMIGDDAYWIPPRLWAYAAENQPDGDMSSFSSEELALLLGCDKHATSIREALLKAGFLDANYTIHNWLEHNGYHAAFKQRAKEAAKARWEKKRKKPSGDPPPPPPPTNTDKDKDKETSIASSMLEASWEVDYGLELPESLRRPECLESAKLWLKYKAERRDTYKPTGLKIALAKWGRDYSPAQFCQVIETYIANGWAGLHSPKESHGPSNSSRLPSIDRNRFIAGADDIQRQLLAKIAADQKLQQDPGYMPFGDFEPAGKVAEDGREPRADSPDGNVGGGVDEGGSHE